MHVILLDRLHQTEVALFDQIEESHAAAHVPFCDAHHRPRIGFNDFSAPNAILYQGFLAQAFRAALAPRAARQFQPGLAACFDPYGRIAPWIARCMSPAPGDLRVGSILRKAIAVCESMTP